MSTWVFDKPVVNGSEYAGMDKFIKAERSASAAGASNFSFASTCSDYDVLYLDNDTAGNSATSILLEQFDTAIDYRIEYKGYKDLNEKLMICN